MLFLWCAYAFIKRVCPLPPPPPSPPHTHTYYYTKIQKVLSSKTNPNLGEAIPVPSQVQLYYK